MKDRKITEWVIDNIVPIIFILFTVVGFSVSDDVPLVFFVRELSSRFFRNIILVLSLIIPVIAGLGLNFGMVIGAMAAQSALVLVRFFDIGGLPGTLIWLALSFPVALRLGYFTGKLYNKTRGQEMIAGLIVGFFANGVYQFVFLYCVGGLIKVPVGHPMVKPDGVGLRATIDMGKPAEGGLQYALAGIAKVPLVWALLLAAVAGLVVLFLAYRKRRALNKTENKGGYLLKAAALLAAAFFLAGEIKGRSMLMSVDLPLVTLMIVIIVCVMTQWIVETKLGQDLNSVGKSQYISKVSGIDVDRKRIIAVMISTVLAALGQVIYLQDMGTFNTYSSHEQIGMFSVAALLVGGASVTKASIWHAILGTALFNAMFIMSPEIGQAVFGQVLLGEYFRTFMVYGVIGLALGIYVWKTKRQKNLSVMGGRSDRASPLFLEKQGGSSNCKQKGEVL